VFFDRRLVLGFLLPVFFNFLRNLNSYRVVFFDLSLPLSAGCVDIVSDLAHLLLELQSHVHPLLFVLIQHFFVFQVQGVILHEDRLTEHLQSFRCL
jgi:hypothetical protein